MRSDRSRRSERAAGARTAAALGAALLVAGLALASPSLIVPGAALLLLSLAVGAWIGLAARGAEVHRTSLPARVVEGEPFELSLSLRSGRLPLLGRLVDPTLEDRPLVACIRPYHRFELTREVALRRRGRHVLAAPALRIADPLGLSARVVSGDGQSAVLALPRVEPILGPDGGGGPSPGVLRKGPGERSGAGLRDTPADPELDGLRPYQPGSPASRIYWPGVARGGELLERRLAGAGGSAPLVALDPTGAGSPEALDRAVRAAASLCRHLARGAGCELLLPGSGRALTVDGRAASWEEALTALALVEAGRGAPFLRDLPADATLIWVAAGGAAATPRAAHGYLVTPEPLPGRAVAFTAAGCHGHRLERVPGRGVEEPAAA